MRSCQLFRQLPERDYYRPLISGTIVAIRIVCLFFTVISFALLIAGAGRCESQEVSITNNLRNKPALLCSRDRFLFNIHAWVHITSSEIGGQYFSVLFTLIVFFICLINLGLHAADLVTHVESVLAGFCLSSAFSCGFLQLKYTIRFDPIYDIMIGAKKNSEIYIWSWMIACVFYMLTGVLFTADLFLTVWWKNIRQRKEQKSLYLFEEYAPTASDSFMTPPSGPEEDINFGV